MSFIVRQISRTAEGREIIRARSFDQAEVSIGRGTDSDVHLPDLQVTLRHAVIRRAGQGRVEIAAVAGIPFDVDGRSTERAEVDPVKGATVRIGGHVLELSNGAAERADAIVTVRRIDADAADAGDREQLFSVAHVMPGKRRTAWALALLILAAFLAWPMLSVLSSEPDPKAGPEVRPVAFHADETWSSGKLSLVHATLENNCQACHAEPFVAVKNESCVACHDKIHDHADPRRLAAAKVSPGISGSIELAAMGVFGIPEGRCVECHTEHEGATAMPVTQQRFCGDCHGGLDQKLTDTKILNASDFGTDHPQFRPAIMSNPEGPKPIVQRVSLDARPLEDHGLKFPHRLHLSRTNGVARMAQSFAGEHGFGKALDCANCHTPDDSGARFKPIKMEEDCGMCHSLAFERIGGTVRTLRHGEPEQVIADLRAYYRSTGPARPINWGSVDRRRPGDFAVQRTSMAFSQAAAARGGRAEAAIRSVFSEGGACFDCHSVTQPGVKGPDFGIVPVRLPDRYMKKGWFDHASHATETCQSCHAAQKSDTASDVLLPKIASCQQCHGGEAAHKQVPSSCAMCHDYHIGEGAPTMVRENRARGKRREQVKTIAAREAGAEG